MPLLMTDIADGAKAASDTFEYPEQNYEKTQQAKQLTQENTLKLQKLMQDTAEESQMKQRMLDTAPLMEGKSIPDKMEHIAKLYSDINPDKALKAYGNAATAREHEYRSSVAKVAAAEHTMGQARQAVDGITTPEDWETSKLSIRKNGLLDEPEIKKIDDQIQGIMNRVKTKTVDENGKERDMTPEERTQVYTDALKPVRDTWHQKLTTFDMAIKEQKTALEAKRADETHQENRIRLDQAETRLNQEVAASRERTTIAQDMNDIRREQARVTSDAKILREIDLLNAKRDASLDHGELAKLQKAVDSYDHWYSSEGTPGETDPKKMSPKQKAQAAYDAELKNIYNQPRERLEKQLSSAGPVASKGSGVASPATSTGSSAVSTNDMKDPKEILQTEYQNLQRKLATNPDDTSIKRSIAQITQEMGDQRIPIPAQTRPPVVAPSGSTQTKDLQKPAEPKFIEGKVYADAKGNKAKYVGGKWVPL